MVRANQAIVMVHENDMVNGGCEFARMFSTTPQDLIADGRIDLAGMHTSTIGLDELSSSLDALAAGRTDDIKVLVDPTV